MRHTEKTVGRDGVGKQEDREGDVRDRESGGWDGRSGRDRMDQNEGGGGGNDKPYNDAWK